jgi:hypothetical protein
MVWDGSRPHSCRDDKLTSPCVKVLFKRKPVKFLPPAVVEDEDEEVGTFFYGSCRIAVCANDASCRFGISRRRAKSLPPTKNI